MNLIKPFFILHSLSAQQKQMLREKQFSAGMNPAEWLQFISGLSEYDRNADSARIIFLVLAIVLIAAGVILAIVFESFLLFSPLSILGLIPLTLYALNRRKDLPNNFRCFILPLLSVLREEFNPGDAVEMKMDFRGGTIDPKQINIREDHPNATEWTYKDPWFQGKARLSDRTSLEWEVLDLIRKRRITKKATSGKLKTKVKYKIRRILSVKLGLPQANYTLAEADSGGSASQVRSQGKRHVVKLRRIIETTDPEAILDVREFLDLATQAYQQVALAPKEEK
jgi:hypothetical protein